MSRNPQSPLLRPSAVGHAPIWVCPLSAVETVVASIGASHLLTVINRDMIPPTPQGITEINHLKIDINDITAPRDGYVHPREEHIARVIGFARRWDHSGPLVVHCWAGISRSTAAAFITLCTLNVDTDEARLARALRVASPTATPNALMVEIADGLLGRGGRMVDAVAGIGNGQFSGESTPFLVPSRLDDE